MFKHLMMLSVALCFSVGAMADDNGRYPQKVAYENAPGPYSTSESTVDCAQEADDCGKCETRCPDLCCYFPEHASGYDTSTKPVASFMNDREHARTWRGECCD